MEIRVLGSGCSKCRSTIGIIERAAQAAGVEVEIVKVENPDEIRRARCQATPAVMIDGKVVHSGGIPSHEEVQAWLEARPHRLPEPPDPASVLHRQGRRRQDLARLRRGARRWPTPGKRVLLVSTDAGVEPRRDAGHRAVATRRVPVPGVPGLSVLNIDPDTAAEAYRAARAGADGRGRQRGRARRPCASSCPAPAPPRSPPSTSSSALLAGDADRLRPRRLRHRADRPHAAPAQPAQGLDRLPGRQRPRAPPASVRTRA